MSLSPYVDFFEGFGRLETPAKILQGVKTHVEDFMGTGQLDKDTLEILVVNHPAGNSIRDLITTEERDILVTKMDILGYRPLELSELIILGIVKPEFFKAPRKEVLNTYKRYTLNNCDRFPVLYRLGDIRYLDASRPAGAWGHGDRFLFIRKWSKE